MVRLIVKSLSLVVLLASLVACQGPAGSSVNLDAPSKTGYRVWDIVDPAIKESFQGHVWYPVSHGAHATPVTGTYFRRAEEAVDAPVADPKKKYPLVIIADDGIAGPDSMAWLAELLVANGYIVAQVRDPATTGDFWKRPAKVTAMITSLLVSDLGSAIDSKEIGFVGYSSGALTGLWLAGAQNPSLQPEKLVPNKDDADPEAYGKVGKLLPTLDIAGWSGSYRDPRITAFVFLAPSWIWIFDDKSFSRITSDVFIISGDHDENVGSARNAVRLAQWIPGAAFKELQGEVNHWEFMGFWTREGVVALRSKLPEGALPTVPLEHRRRFVHDEVAELTIEFFNHNLHAKS